MLILKYFLTVGTALTLGLFALSSHLGPSGSVAVHAATTASLPTVVPTPQPAKASLAVDPAPKKPAKSTSSRRHKQTGSRASR